MGLAENRKKSSEMAQYMKKMGIKRTTGACPWGCGAQIPIGGQGLMIHLSRCQGGGKRRFKRK